MMKTMAAAPPKQSPTITFRGEKLLSRRDSTNPKEQPTQRTVPSTSQRTLENHLLLTKRGTMAFETLTVCELRRMFNHVRSGQADCDMHSFLKVHRSRGILLGYQKRIEGAQCYFPESRRRAFPQVSSHMLSPFFRNRVLNPKDHAASRHCNTLNFLITRVSEIR